MASRALGEGAHLELWNGCWLADDDMITFTFMYNDEITSSVKLNDESPCVRSYVCTLSLVQVNLKQGTSSVWK